eukprot:m.144005 g.144005  ORF g.144005 m.144005 type:complete len:309 (-) comp20448_c0_seq2:22-948(-)
MLFGWLAAVGAVLAAIVWWFWPALTAFFGWRSKPEIPRAAECSNPNCVRCRQYKAVAQQAMVKLRCLLQEDRVSAVPKRLEEAVRRSTLTPKQPAPPSWQQPTLLHIHGLPSSPWWDTVPRRLDDLFRRLEASAAQIAEEATAAFEQQELVKSNDVPSGQWNAVYFCNQGILNTLLLKNCAAVSTLLKDFDDVIMTKSVFGNVFFSRIWPGTHVEPHCGPTNTRLRVHLGLQIPPGCSISVAGEIRTWAVGKCVCFDDSYLHSVSFPKTKSGQPCRIVLILDLWHPNLAPEEASMLQQLFSAAAVQHQ